MKLSIKRNTCLTLLAASAALTVSACSGVEVRPAVQGPRYYTAAHDTVTGKCEREKVVPVSKHHQNVVQRALPKHEDAVRCVTTAVTTTGESN